MTMLYVLATLAILPFLSIYFIQFLLQLIGSYLRSKTQVRRDKILAQPKRESAAVEPKQKSSRTEDDDWERIDGYATPTAPNGAIPQDPEWEGVIGFFHPFCNAGGGGERVLWAAIRATQARWPRATCVVYSGDHDLDRTMMVSSVQSRFGIALNPSTLHFIYLSCRQFVLASTWPHFTLLGQSIGSIVLVCEAFNLLVPDIFIDTMGYAFALAVCKYLFPSVPTAAYVHYPTISTDMLDSLDDTTGGQGVNSGTGTGTRGELKRMYWRLFAKLYGWVGGHIDVVMCNSSWTRNHIAALWKLKDAATVVYPPCPVEEFEKKINVSKANEKDRQRVILYIAQFRPEKNHSLILKSFAKFHDSTVGKDWRLVLLGSVRTGTLDEKHVYKLRLEARELKIDAATTFWCDASFPQIQDNLGRASIGTNGMWNEHFGIGVVEYIAAGLIPVVHASGGPKLDIVTLHDGRPTGYLAETVEQFAEGFSKVAAMGEEEKVAMRLRGRESAKRFTEEAFAKLWTGKMEQLIKMQVTRQKDFVGVKS